MDVKVKKIKITFICSFGGYVLKRISESLIYISGLHISFGQFQYTETCDV